MSLISASQDEYIEALKKTYEQLTADFLRLNQEKSRTEHMVKIEAKKAEEKLQEQKKHYESIVDELTKRGHQLEEQIKRLQTEENIHYRKEIRKYVEGINEKEVEISNLRRQLAAQKNKIGTLEQEINNLTNMKENYQMYVLKAIEQLKSNIKEAYNIMEETDNQKMVLQSKFRQLNEKTILFQNQLYEVQVQKNSLQQNYNKLKLLYKASKDNFLQVKIELEKYKEISKGNPEQLPVPEAKPDYEGQIVKELEGINEIRFLLNEQESFLKQTHDYWEANKKLVEANHQLQEKNIQLEKEIDKIKCKIVPGYENDLVKKQQPSLYQFLLQKKSEILKFEKSLEAIEAYMEEKDEYMNQVISMFKEKSAKCVCGKEEELQKLSIQIDQLKRKHESVLKMNQRLQKEHQGYEDRTDKYIEQIKKLTGKSVKRKKNQKRCKECYFVLDKKEAEKCQSCQQSFHTEGCLKNHVCALFKIEETESAMSQFDE